MSFIQVRRVRNTCKYKIAVYLSYTTIISNYAQDISIYTFYNKLCQHFFFI